MKHETRNISRPTEYLRSFGRTHLIPPPIEISRGGKKKVCFKFLVANYIIYISPEGGLNSRLHSYQECVLPLNYLGSGFSGLPAYADPSADGQSFGKQVCQLNHMDNHTVQIYHIKIYISIIISKNPVSGAMGFYFLNGTLG